jgi:hypothetical protein
MSHREYIRPGLRRGLLLPNQRSMLMLPSRADRIARMG